MKTTFLIIKVVSIRHDDPMQIVDELQSFITKSGDNTESREVIKSDIVELQTTAN